MTRVITANYTAVPETTFQYATVDDDQFDRELDMSFVARAVEQHNHSAGKGLAVTRIAAGIIDTTALANGAVTTAKLADLNVTNAKLALDSVTATQIAAGSVGSSEIVDGGVGTLEIADLAVTTAKLFDGSVTAPKLATDAVTTTKIGPNAVTTAKLAISAVTATELATDAVTNAKIQAGAVDSGKLANGSVITAKIAALNVGTAELAAGAVTAAKIADGNVTAVKLAANIVDNTKLATGAAVANLGYTPVNKTGDTMTGNLTFSDNFEGILLAGGGQIRDDISVNLETQFFTNGGRFAMYNEAGTTELMRVREADAASTFKGATQWNSGHFAQPTATPTAGRVPVADGSGRLDSWISAAAASYLVGEVKMVGFLAGSAAGVAAKAAGFLFCDGSAVSRATHAALFSAISTAYGAGNGSTTFNLPTWSDRFPMGRSGSKALGSVGGSATTDVSHNHAASALGVSGNTGSESADNGLGNNGGTSTPAVGHTHNQGTLDVTGSTDNWVATAVATLSPYQAVEYIIYSGVAT